MKYKTVYSERLNLKNVEGFGENLQVNIKFDSHEHLIIEFQNSFTIRLTKYQARKFVAKISRVVPSIDILNRHLMLKENEFINDPVDW